MRADPKPAPRLRDAATLADFPRDRECISCGHGLGVAAHYILHRSQGGDDVRHNFVGLCHGCHGAYHGNPFTAFGVKIDAAHVRRAIGRWLRSEAGENARWYLTARLGVEGSLAFQDRLEA